MSSFNHWLWFHWVICICQLFLKVFEFAGLFSADSVNIKQQMLAKKFKNQEHTTVKHNELTIH
jgi:hypothetical protein